jgi:hypothetical protein
MRAGTGDLEILSIVTVDERYTRNRAVRAPRGGRCERDADGVEATSNHIRGRYRAYRHRWWKSIGNVPARQAA